jgi:hypothetical protein
MAASAPEAFLPRVTDTIICNLGHYLGPVKKLSGISPAGRLRLAVRRQGIRGLKCSVVPRQGSAWGLCWAIEDKAKIPLPITTAVNASTQNVS